MGCGADDLGIQLYNKLIAGANFDLPVIDFTGSEFDIPADDPELIDLKTVTIEELTEGKVNGNGAFDIIMKSAKAHLKEEYENGRITGKEFADSYTRTLETALATGLQFVLGKDQTYWQALLIKQQARNAKLEFINIRLAIKSAMLQYNVARVQAEGAKADLALKKLQLSILDTDYCIKQEELANAILDKDIKTYTLDTMMPKQLLMLEEQIETQRAQTSDTRSDGTPIVGLLGKQKDLYTQQITSYQRDAEVKVAKLFTDAWITMKTIDEGLLPPSGFANTSLDTILSKLKLNTLLN